MEFLRLPGRVFLDTMRYLGQIVGLTVDVGAAVRAGGWRMRLIAQQIVAIGYGSQIVVIVTGAFTGAVFTFQTYAKIKDFGVESSVGAMVSTALCRELGAVLAGLMVAGRVGAAMAADIGTMKVSEQVDALRVMGVHPVDYLVLPRFIGMMISIPLLIAECISFGLVASYLVAVVSYGVPSSWFMGHLLAHTNMLDVSIGMIKGLVFGILITLISCHQGLRAENGAVGVGQGTTRAVVYSSLSILVSNFFLSILLNHLSPLGTGN